MDFNILDTKIGDRVLNAAALAGISGGLGGAVANTTITTVGAGVLTAAALKGGVISRTGSTADFTDTTDTAAAIASAAGGVGISFSVSIKNLTAFQETLAAGTGVTMSTVTIVPPMSVTEYLVTIAGTAAAPTATFTHVSTGPARASSGTTNPQTTALTTVGAGTILAAPINTGVLERSGSTAAFTDTTDTAAAIIAGAQGLGIVGASLRFTYANNTVAPATIAGGANVTVSGATVVPPNSWVDYLVTRTTATALTFVAVAQGYFPKVGVTGAANGATPVAVVDARVTATSIIALSLNTTGGTPHGAFVSSITPGTGFSINSLAGDTSTYNYEIRG